jgi:hypothetical protein
LPAKDHHHQTVIRALIKDGWKIEDEQCTLAVRERNLWIDIQASRELPHLVIFVEVRALSNVDSPAQALANAIRTLGHYRMLLLSKRITFPLYLAITQRSHEGILKEIGQTVLEATRIPLIIFDEVLEEIVQWTP